MSKIRSYCKQIPLLQIYIFLIQNFLVAVRVLTSICLSSKDCPCGTKYQWVFSAIPLQEGGGGGGAINVFLGPSVMIIKYYNIPSVFFSIFLYFNFFCLIFFFFVFLYYFMFYFNIFLLSSLCPLSMPLPPSGLCVNKNCHVVRETERNRQKCKSSRTTKRKVIFYILYKDI